MTLATIFFIFFLLALETLRSQALAAAATTPTDTDSDAVPIAISDSGATALAQAALARTELRVRYDGSYQILSYPFGDVAADVGVCTDLVIRAFRTLAVDLQQLVHEDMRDHFDAYPDHWGLDRPDPNIDHRRVPNLERFFQRHGQSLATTRDAELYEPGDIMTWRLNGSLPHIGIVSHRQAVGSERPLIIHNIGSGPEEEDVLFAYPIHGHYRYRVAERR
ncbi:MAG: DUF1287 domain-containing protein [Pseudomonadota bacterium]